MFNPNFLGHELILYTKFYPTDDYICVKCKIKLYHIGYDKDNYLIFENQDTNEGICKVNCEEFIIKGIIE